MGGICSKSSNPPDNFQTPGRVLGSAPPAAPKTAPTPKKVTAAGGPGRTLGGPSSGTGETNDARSAAAKAAEERAAKAARTGTGKLASQLEAQKKQNRNELLGAASEQERKQRDADAAEEARAYN